MALTLLADDEEWFNIPHVIRIALRSIADSNQHNSKQLAENNLTIQGLQRHVTSLENKIKAMEEERATDKVNEKILINSTLAANNNRYLLRSELPHPSDILTMSSEPFRTFQTKLQSVSTSVLSLQSSVTAIKNSQNTNHHAAASAAASLQVQQQLMTMTDLKRHVSQQDATLANGIQSVAESVRSIEERLKSVDHGTLQFAKEIRNRVGMLESHMSHVQKSISGIENVKEMSVRMDASLRDQSDRLNGLMQGLRSVEMTMSNQNQNHHFTQQNRNHHSPTIPSSSAAFTIDDWTLFNNELSAVKTMFATFKRDTAVHNEDVNAQLKELLVRYEGLKQSQLGMHDALVEKVKETVPPLVISSLSLSTNDKKNQKRTSCGATEDEDHEEESSPLFAQIKTLTNNYREQNEKFVALRDTIDEFVKNGGRGRRKPSAADETSRRKGKNATRERADDNSSNTSDESPPVVAKRQLIIAHEKLEHTIHKLERRVKDVELLAMRTQSQFTKEDEKLQQQFDAIEANLSRQQASFVDDIKQLKAAVDAEHQAQFLEHQHNQHQRLSQRVSALENELDTLRDSTRQRLELYSQEQNNRISAFEAKCHDVSVRMDSLTAVCIKQFDDVKVKLSDNKENLSSIVSTVKSENEASAKRIMEETQRTISTTVDAVVATAVATASVGSAPSNSVSPSSLNSPSPMQSSSRRRGTTDRESLAEKTTNHRSGSRSASSSNHSRRRRIQKKLREQTINLDSSSNTSNSDESEDDEIKDRNEILSTDEEIEAEIERRYRQKEKKQSRKTQKDVSELKLKLSAVETQTTLVASQQKHQCELLNVLSDDFGKSIQKQLKDRTEDLKFMDMLEARMGALEMKLKESEETLLRNDNAKHGADGKKLLSSSSPTASHDSVSTLSITTQITEAFVKDMLILRELVHSNSEESSKRIATLKKELSERLDCCEEALGKIEPTIASAVAASAPQQQRQQEQWTLNQQQQQSAQTSSSAFTHATAEAALASALLNGSKSSSASTTAAREISKAVAEEVKREIESNFYTRDEVDGIMLSQMMTVVGRLSQKADAITPVAQLFSAASLATAM